MSEIICKVVKCPYCGQKNIVHFAPGKQGVICEGPRWRRAGCGRKFLVKWKSIAKPEVYK